MPSFLLDPVDPSEDAAPLINALFAQGGEHTTVYLCQSTHYYTRTIIKPTHSFQTLATLEFPTSSSLKAVIHPVNPTEAAVLNGVGHTGTSVRSLVIQGGRDQFGPAPQGGNGGLINLGGPGTSDVSMMHCELFHPRGWTCAHIIDFTVGAKVLHNLIDKSGKEAWFEPAWADGLSVACRDGFIIGNTVIDATDGAIVVFCAPGTVVMGNTIIARTRSLLGGINMVDPFPFESDFTGVKVCGNRFISEGPLIRTGIAIGMGSWSNNDDMKARLFGGTVTDNHFGPGNFGYAISAAGCRDFTVQRNTIDPCTIFNAKMPPNIENNIPPSPFVRSRIPDWAHGDFQPEFVWGDIAFLIGIDTGRSQKMKWPAGALELQPRDPRAPALEWRRYEHEMEKVTFACSSEGQLLVFDNATKQVLWSTPKSHLRPVGTPKFAFTKDGRLEIVDDRQTLWSPAPKPTDTETEQSRNMLIMQDEAPYLTILSTNSSTLFTTHYDFISFELLAGAFISVASSAVGNNGAPPVPPRHTRPLDALAERLEISASRFENSNDPVFLYLDPRYSQLVLHKAKRPTEYEDKDVIWRSPNWRMVESKPEEVARAVLQGDGNLVIYTDGGAAWATGTNNGEDHRKHLRLYHSNDPQGARLEIQQNDRVLWSSM